MIKEFQPSVIEALKYYVYCLVDPRDNRIFYIGKGKGNRVFQHAKDSLNENDQSLKLDIIRSILREGKQVGLYILRHNLTEETAFVVESVLIDLLTYTKFNKTNQLANIAAGHHQWDEGIKSIDEINAIYNCDKIDVTSGDTFLLVSLNKSFDQAKANGVYRRVDIYEATRKYWKISKYKGPSIKYVLGVYKGVVRSVIEVASLKWSNVAEDSTRFKCERCIFEGKLLEDSPYLNKDVSDYPFGSGGAIRYIAAGHHQWDEGIKSIDEINAIYNCDKIDVTSGDTFLLVSLNKSFDQAKANGVYRRVDIYEATRKYWKISKYKAPKIKYVLGVYKGVVRSVIEVASLKWSNVAEDSTRFKCERCIFEGKLIEDSPYLNKDVSDYPFGSGGAIRYIEGL